MDFLEDELENKNKHIKYFLGWDYQYERWSVDGVGKIWWRRRRKKCDEEEEEKKKRKKKKNLTPKTKLLTLENFKVMWCKKKNRNDSKFVQEI